MNYIDYQLVDRVAVITLNRPQALNALSDDLKKELFSTINQSLKDETVRVIVLTGEGKGFCAGGDIKAQATRDNNAIERRSIFKEMNNMIRAVYQSPKPIICAVNGFAIGAGLGLALMGDLIVSSSKAKFSAPFIKLGLVSDAGVSYMMSRRIGLGKTKRLLLTGESINGELAEKWGLVDWLVEPEELMTTTLKIARDLANSSEIAVDIIKSISNNIQDVSFDVALDQEMSNQIMCLHSSEHKERVKAFVESIKK
ncbi:enoyl-CoA hydratase/isomerase family protein [Oceanobacillus longus]|uniref:Enoyl-CoA hydratase/isomerase family protein n=1 Tax=Oceanobacillus longus TaxID=930120 RepID=A0ABV8GXI1_9BACI